MTISLTKKTIGQGENIVFLHGWGVNSTVWQGISESLEAQFRVTYVDLPGFGQNATHLPHPYNLSAVADLVSHSLPPRCILVGWSLGGLVAQKIALSRPERIEKLILIASSPKFVAAADWPGIDGKILGMFEQQLTRNFSKTVDRFLAIQAMGSGTAKGDIKWLRNSIEQLPSPSLIALSAGLKILAETDLRSQLATLKMKSHWMFGQLDTLVPVSLVSRLPSLQARASCSIVNQASHAPFISHPQTFINQLFALIKA